MDYTKTVPYIGHDKTIDSFWHYAELTDTYQRDHRRNNIARCKYDIQFGRGKFRRRRRFVDPRTGERRETIEIEIETYQ